MKLPTRLIPVILQQGRVISGDYIYLKWLKGETPTLRLQLLVPKKVSVNKVTQHYYKRVLREAVRQAVSQHTSPIDGLVIAKPSINTASLMDLSQEISRVLSLVK